MKMKYFGTACLLLFLAVATFAGESANWYWHEAKPLERTTRYFRMNLDLPADAKQSELYFAVDDIGKIYVNGEMVKHNQTMHPIARNLGGKLRKGNNVIAVEAQNHIGSAGVICRGTVTLTDGTVMAVSGNDRFLSSDAAPANWTAVAFDDSSWSKAVKIGRCDAAPWGDLIDWAKLADAAIVPPPIPEKPSFWLWHEEKPLPKTTRYFRLTLDLPAAPVKSSVYFACDDIGKIYLNGKLIKTGQTMKPVLREKDFALKKGKNVIAVEVDNHSGPAGMICRGELQMRHSPSVIIVSSNDNFKSSDRKEEGWTAVEFDDSAWPVARKVAPADGAPWAKMVDMSPLYPEGAVEMEPATAGRLMIDDFAQISSWMGGGGAGKRPGAQYPFDFSLGSTPDERRDDGWAGAFHFDFIEPGKSVLMQKNAAFKMTTVPSRIEFSANPEGWGGDVYFVLVDKFGTTFETDSVKISGDEWRDYQLAINDATVRNYDRIRFPLAMRQIGFRPDRPGRGRILIDDIAYRADVSQPNRQLEIHPVYRKLAFVPNSPVKMEFQLRNSLEKAVSAQLELNVYDRERKVLLTRKAKQNLPGFGLEKVEFDLGSFPVKGGYNVVLTADNGEIKSVFSGWLGIFEPNNRRINQSPMWFGVEDQEVNTAPYEAALHAEWMKTLGVDMMRGGFLGEKTESVRGDQAGYEGVRRMWQPHVDAGLMILLDYAAAVPRWTLTQEGRKQGNGLQVDPELFAEHMTQVGEFIRSIPAIRYFEWFNEPDLGSYAGTTEEYTASLRMLYPILKKINPDLRVTTGGVVVAPHPRSKPDFVRTLYQDTADAYDVVAFHGHDGYASYKDHIPRIKAMLNAKGIQRPIAQTEAGYRSYQNQPELFYVQACQLIQKIASSKHDGLEFYIWFMLQDYWDKYINADDSFGLVTVDNQPKPAFVTYNELIRQLANMAPAKPLVLDPRLESFRFVGGGEEVSVVWPRGNGADLSFSMKATGPVKHIDMYGNEQTLTPRHGVVFINSGKEPYYLRTQEGALLETGELLAISGGSVLMPGERRTLTLQIQNPFDMPVSYRLTQGSAEAKGKIAAQKQAATSWPLVIPDDAKPSASAMLFHLEFVTDKGEVLYTGTISLSYSVALPVPPSGKTGASIVLDDETVLTELVFDPTTPRWSGKEDLSAKFSIVYDQTGLLFDVKVHDQDHSAPDHGVMNWRNDSIQLGFATADGRQTEITVSDSPDGALAWRHIAEDPAKIGKLDIPLTVERRDGVTSYRFSVPWNEIGLDAKRDSLFRMSLLVNDNDGKKRLRLMEYFKGIEGSKAPELFGWVQLTK